MISEGELVLLVSPKGKRYMRRLTLREPLHTGDGRLDMSSVQEAGFGGYATTHLGRDYLVLKPTLHDMCKNLKRQTQIIYPKDIGYICMRLSIGPGARVIEAGSGSGSMTLALAWYVGPTGKVYTHERREEFRKLCGRNLAWAGLDDGRVQQYDRDIADGFAEESANADALFLDVREPWEYLELAAGAVKPGAPLGFLLPTVNQVSDLVRGLQAGPFMDVEIAEILVRRYKPVPDRLRPADRMIAHTGFLVFCRAAVPPFDPEPVRKSVHEIPVGDFRAASARASARESARDSTREAMREAGGCAPLSDPDEFGPDTGPDMGTDVGDAPNGVRDGAQDLDGE